MAVRVPVRLAGVAASLCAAALGTPAHAASAGAGAVLALSPSGLHSVNAALSYDATPVPGGSLVTFDCKAVAAVDPASTGFSTCTVYGEPAVGSPGNYPGAVAAAAGVTFVPDDTVAYGCVRAHATFVEGIVGPTFVQTRLGCERLNLVVVGTGG